MSEAVTGRIFDIQRFSIHDGPGIRTTVFFQGCPLRCRWCHNPEAMNARPSIFYTERLCIHCRACQAACPEEGHLFEGEEHRMFRGRCRLCGACVQACVAGALEAAGREASAAEVVEVVLRDRVFYETSKGGVTLSGGEPLVQPDFAADILTRCREEGLHTAVDTCGHAPARALEQLLPLTDLWLYDLKHLDPEAHRRATGLLNTRILENLRRLNAAGAAVMVRVPLIPGYNDTDENLSAMETLIAGLSCVREVRILPYHRFQEDKYRRLGLQYPGGDIVSPEDTHTAAIRDRLAASTGLPVAVGG